MNVRLTTSSIALLFCLALAGCGEAEQPQEVDAAAEVGETEKPKPVYNAVAPTVPEVHDDGVRVLLDAPLVEGLVMSIDYSVLKQELQESEPYRVETTELEVFGSSEVEAVDQLTSSLQSAGFQLLDSKGTKGLLHRYYARGGRTVYDGADTVKVIASGFSRSVKPSNPAARAHLRITASMQPK